MKGNSFTSNKKTSIKTKSIILSVISIIELILILTTMTYSWFEGLTSLEIIGENLNTANGLNSEFIIGEGPDYENTTAELNTFFDAQTSGELDPQTKGKLSPVSSFDGENFYALYSGNATNYESYLKGVENGTLKFRKLNDEDVNSSIISFQFKVTAATSDTDFWLNKMPVFTVGGTALSNENNPFRIRIDDGDGDAANGEGNLILTTKETWPADGKYSTLSSRTNMLALTGVNADDTGKLKEETTEITNPAINKVFDGRKCDNNGWLINDNGEFIDANGNVTEEGTVKNLNQNGKQVLFSVKKGETKTITITIWLEALDQAFTTTNIKPGAEVEIYLEFCSSWDVMDTITFRDRTAEQRFSNVNANENNATQILGVVNLGSDNNHWYATKADGSDPLFTYDATTHNWTGQIPRAVQNIKFQWQTKGTSDADAYWEAGVRGTNTTYTAFGEENKVGVGLWYSGKAIPVTFSDYTTTNLINTSSHKMRVQVDYNDTTLAYSMSDAPTKDTSDKNTWSAFIPDVSTVTFNCCNSNKDVIYTWNGENRGLETAYYALDKENLDQDERVYIYLSIPKNTPNDDVPDNLLSHIKNGNNYIGPVISLTSTANVNYVSGLDNNTNDVTKADRALVNKYTYRVSGAAGAERDTLPGDTGLMTKVTVTSEDSDSHDEYYETFVYAFDQLEANTYLTFWSKSQDYGNNDEDANVDNDSWLAPCFFYDGTNNRFLIDDPKEIEGGNIKSTYVYTHADTEVYNGSAGNVTTPGEEQTGQWGYDTYFYHPYNTATSVTAKFNYDGAEHTVTMVQDETDKQLWKATKGAIPTGVTQITFTDNSNREWTASTTERSFYSRYYVPSTASTGEWRGAVTLPESSYETVFKHSKTVTSVNASFTYKGSTYSVTLENKNGDGYDWTDNKKIPEEATDLKFTDGNSTWSNITGRSSTKNYYYVFNSGNGELSSAGQYRVYLTNNKSWSAVSVYSWVTGSSGSPAWPGKAMTNLYTDPTSGYKIYAALVPSGQNIIFNNNNAGQQSKDILSNYVYDMAGFVLSGSSTPYEYLIYNAKNGNYASANVTAGTYGTRFVHTGTVTGVSAVFTLNNVEYTVPMTLEDGTTWITHAIPNAVTTITFKDTSNRTWNNTAGRSETKKYYFMDSNTTGHWGEAPTTGKTIKVGIIEWISNINQVYYWCSDGTNGTINLSDLTSTPKSYSVGSNYWNNAAQTFNCYEITVPDNVSGIKFKNSSNQWFGADVNDFGNGKIHIIFEWSRVYHNQTKTY